MSNPNPFGAPPSLPVPVPSLPTPMGPTTAEARTSSATVAPVTEAFVTGATKPRLVTDEGTEATPELPREPSIPIPQRMGICRDALLKKYPKSLITVRLDVTSTPPGTEYLIYISGGLPVGHRAFVTGVFGKWETLRNMEIAVESEVGPEVKA